MTADLSTLIGQLHPESRDAIPGGTVRRFYALGPPAVVASRRGR